MNNTTAKRMIAVGQMYRGIAIDQETEERFVILDESGRRYEFETYAEACGFVDAWYVMQLFDEAMTP